jgi:hypothetical protein
MEGQGQPHWDWDRLERVHAYGINIGKATEDQVEEYVLTKMHVYKKNNFKDYTLWEVFAEDFGTFDLNDFKILRSATKAKLRLLLLGRGVFVGKRTKLLTLYQALYNTAQDEEQHEWTDEELTEALVDIDRPMITGALRKRLNSSRTGLRTEDQEHSEAQSQQSLTSQVGDQCRDPFQPNISLSHVHTPAPQPPSQQAPVSNISDHQFGQLPPHSRPQSPPQQPSQLPLQTTQQSQPHDQSPLLPKPPLAQPAHRASQGGYGKEIATITKIYSDSQKYSGVDDSFDFKLTIFYNICTRSGLPPDYYALAFPSMLKSMAERHYFNAHLAAQLFEKACQLMRDFFEGDEYYRKNLIEWNAITIQGVINDKENQDKTLSQCLQILIDKLCKQQYAINP